MITIEQCRKFLASEDLPDERIKEIRDYLYALSKEIIRNNIQNYEKNVRETTQSQ